MSPSISKVALTRATSDEMIGGFLGWLAITIDDYLVLDGIGLRRTQQGNLRLAFPVRRSRRGHRHAIVRPLNNQARADLEAQVLAALNMDGRSV